MWTSFGKAYALMAQKFCVGVHIQVPELNFFRWPPGVTNRVCFALFHLLRCLVSADTHEQMVRFRRKFVRLKAHSIVFQVNIANSMPALLRFEQLKRLLSGCFT